MEFQQYVDLVADGLAHGLDRSTRTPEVGAGNLPASRAEGIKLQRLVPAAHDFASLVP